jgi:hypothetical protein
MVRFSLAVIALFLAVAAVGCSGSVAPPGATLSGTVYYDRNANGARDSCDGASPKKATTVRLSDRDDPEKLYMATTTTGDWTIENVPPGEYVLTLAPSSRGFWLTTGPSRDRAEPAYELSLRGFEERSGLDFGVARLDPVLAQPGTHVSYAVVFNDRDRDEEVDQDECLVSESPERPGSVIPAASQIWSNPGTHPRSSQITIEFGPDLSHWRPVRSQSWGECSAKVRGISTWNPTVTFYSVPAQWAPPDSTLIVRMFADDNADGAVNEQEDSLFRLVPLVLQSASGCDLELPIREGEETPLELWEGIWTIDFDHKTVCPIGCTFTEHEMTTDLPVSVEVTAGQTTTLNLGIPVNSPGKLVVRVIDDRNGDGEEQAGELVLGNVPVCVEALAASYGGIPSLSGNWSVCQHTDRTGAASFTRLEAGEYSVTIDFPAGLEATWDEPEATLFSLTSNEERRLTLFLRETGSPGITSCATLSC